MHVISFAILVAMTAACAAAGPRPLPTAHLGSAEDAVQEASREGAERDPRASKHLHLAQAQIGRARGLIRQGEYDEAESLLRRASADAEVAVALSREAQQRAEADAARMRVASTSTRDPRR